jgi:hypothetical protein
MLSLAEIQSCMAADILDGGTRSAYMLRSGLVSPTEALCVHRNTVLAGIANALRLSYPTVDRLTGEEFFDAAAVAYARAYPPRDARLLAYGDDFPHFVETYLPAQGLPYLGDVARFDLAIERASQHPHDAYGATIALDESTFLALLHSLACLRVNYPTDLIRDALDAGQEDTLRNVDMRPYPRNFAIWRSASGVSVKLLTMPAAAFVRALLDGQSSEIALASALDCVLPDTAISSIQSEVFTASFARVTHSQSKGVTR